jgi:hypothetical protein
MYDMLLDCMRHLVRKGAPVLGARVHAGIMTKYCTGHHNFSTSAHCMLLATASIADVTAMLCCFAVSWPASASDLQVFLT